MCNKAILKNGGTLQAVPDWCKTQRMYNKAVDSYTHVKFVPRNEICISQEMCINLIQDGQKGPLPVFPL